VAPRFENPSTTGVESTARDCHPGFVAPPESAQGFRPSSKVVLYATLTPVCGMAIADHDGTGFVAESCDYASGTPLEAIAGTWAGPQHPTFRYDHRGRRRFFS